MSALRAKFRPEFVLKKWVISCSLVNRNYARLSRNILAERSAYVDCYVA